MRSIRPRRPAAAARTDRPRTPGRPRPPGSGARRRSRRDRCRRRAIPPGQGQSPRPGRPRPSRSRGRGQRARRGQQVRPGRRVRWAHRGDRLAHEELAAASGHEHTRADDDAQAAEFRPADDMLKRHASSPAIDHRRQARRASWRLRSAAAPLPQQTRIRPSAAARRGPPRRWLDWQAQRRRSASHQAWRRDHAT